MIIDVSMVKAKRSIIRSRKNLGLVCDILKKIKNKKDGRKAGSSISSALIEEVIKTSNLDGRWDLNPQASDLNGLRRTLGDLLGGHGLKLKKLSNGEYEIPKRLPVMDGDDLIEEAIY